MDIKYQSILDIANKIKSEADKVNSLLNNDVKNTVNSVKNVWTGEASEKYQSRFNQLSNQFETFYKELISLSAFLTNTVETYQAAEKEISRISDDVLDTGSNI